jgi:hypothetical protein
VEWGNRGKASKERIRAEKNVECKIQKGKVAVRVYKVRRTEKYIMVVSTQLFILGKWEK